MRLNFNQKIVALFVGTIAFTVAFSFLFLHFLYKDLYINSIRESVAYQGQQTAAHYHYGQLTEEIIGKIQWYNIVSEYEVIIVNEFEELNATFPNKINGENLVSENDRAILLSGQSVIKEGYVDIYKKDVIGAIYPIMTENEPIGYLFIYVPLSGLTEVFGKSIPILFIIGIIFFLITSIVLNRMRKALFQPLLEIQQLSQEVSKGAYEKRLTIRQMDEIGQMAKAFNDMSDALQHDEQRKREFLANIVHELRTPLTYISGYSEVLQKQNLSPEETATYLLTIEKETGRMKKLLADLVELNYLQENLLSFEAQPIVVSQLLFDTVDLFLILSQDRQLNFAIEVDEELIVFHDEKRLQQIFYNVIDNAVKYATEKTTIIVNVVQVEDQMVFTVQNEGTVLTEEDVARIGERFYRTDKARNRQTGGTGLGVSIVKEIVRILEGEISIQTNGEFFIITISLPIKETEYE